MVCYDTGGCVEQAKNNNVYLIKKQGKEENIKNIELMVWEFNENAIKFYKNLGMSIKNLKFVKNNLFT